MTRSEGGQPESNVSGSDMTGRALILFAGPAVVEAVRR